MLFNFFSRQPTKDPWYTHAAVYQIYPWSFQDSNNDGIGDIRGIINRLPYLNDGTKNSLGIQAVWICPIYKSPMKDFGYDIADFYSIDPQFGTQKDFDDLVTELHKRGMRLIMDLVINHTSSEHEWFKESRSSKTNWKRDWYVWRDPKPDGSPPNNWVSVSGGSAWTLDPATNQYYLHQFLPDQPDLNWRNEYVIYEMQNIIRYWLDRGVDGFRVDAFSHLIEDGLFRDDPVDTGSSIQNPADYGMYTHTYSANRPQLKRIINYLMSAAQEKPDTFMVFEAYLPLKELVDMYSLHESNQYAPFNFNFLTMPWSAQDYRKFVDEYDRSLPQQVPIYVFGNHDKPRLISRLDEARARICALFLLTIRGMPFIYYGEEIGMKNVSIEKKDIRDGFATQSLDTTMSRDPYRTPMQWTNELHAGFSTQKPWLPLSPDFQEYNVLSESKNPRSMLSLYQSILQYRNSSPALTKGRYESIDTKHTDVFGYIRSHKRHPRILVLLNFKNEMVSIPFPYKGTYILSTELDIPTGTPIAHNVTLRPYEGCMFEI